MTKRRIVLYGAAGHTGQFIATELARRGLDPLLAGRDAGRLEPVAARIGAPVREVTVEDAAGLDVLLLGADAVINAAGPFGETAPLLIEAALRARIPYLDVTAEPFVARDTFDRFAERARAAGTIVAPAFAFFGALGDLLVTAALDGRTSADQVELAFALDRWQPTKGTRLAGERRAGRRLVRDNGKLETRDPSQPPPKGTWQFLEPFGEQETVGEFSTVDVITISNHIDAKRISTWINTAPLADLAAAGSDGPKAADASGRSAQQFLIEAIVRQAGKDRRASISGRDIYAITAPIVVEAVEWILAGRAKASGVVAAGQLFDARAFLSALAPAFASLRLEPGVERRIPDAADAPPRQQPLSTK